jgi:hypothetical protein
MLALFSMVTLRSGAGAVEAPHEAQALDAGAAPSGSQAEDAVSLQSTVTSLSAQVAALEALLAQRGGSSGTAAAGAPAAASRALKQETVTKDFPKYAGRRSNSDLPVEDWIDKFEKRVSMAEDVGADGAEFSAKQKVAMARLCLDGDAAVFIENKIISDTTIRYDWLLFRSCLVEHYSNEMGVKERYFKRLFTLLCLEGDPLDSDPDVVVEEHRLACSKLIGMSNEMRYFTFLFSLSAAPARAVRMHCADFNIEEAYRAAKLNGERDATKSVSRAVPTFWDRGNAATFGPPAISGAAATRAQTATELEFQERTLQPLDLGGGRMWYPPTLHGSMDDKDKHMRRWLSHNNICYFCRNKGHTSFECPKSTSSKR